MSRSVQQFGRYELFERISAGGMAEVFRGQDLDTRDIVALKRILPQVAEDDEFVKMFEDEARIAAQLEHPYIARTLDFGHVGESYYIAFEYVDGRDLRAMFDRSVRTGDKPPLAFLLYVFARIAEGLAYAHGRKDDHGNPRSIVHRDVSPQNIIVSYDGDVKLIDFGIAKAAGKLSRTQVGTLKGKFGYMAPEQIKGLEIDHRADLFSLGICMWELLTLERLFDGENELLVLEKVRSATIAPPSSRNHDVSPELDRIVLKALAKDPDERYRTAKDLFRDIDKLAATIGATASREDVARVMRRAFPESLARRASPSDTGADVIVNEEPHQQPTTSGGRVPSRAGHVKMETMAADNPSSDKRSSDLDIFEGLGKKAAAPAQQSSRPPSVPPPPPSRQAPPMIVKSDVGKKTLVGIPPAAVAPPPSIPVPPPAPASSTPATAGPRIATPNPSRSAPPPPPGRASLPQVVPPPQRASIPPGAIPRDTSTTPGVGQAAARPASVAPPPAAAAAAPAAAPVGSTTTKSNLDMDWDDEDEATHIFDKPGDEMPQREERAPRPAAGTPLAPPVAAAAAMPNPKSTLMGIPAPVLPPPPAAPSRASAPPPPPPSNAFMRPSSAPPSFPSPSAPPQPHGMPPQVSTAPMPMPGKPSVPPPVAPPQNGVHASGYPTAAQLPPVMSASMAARMEATQLVRPSGSRLGLIGTAAGCAAVAAALVVYIALPTTGRIAINVADSKGSSPARVEIFVDGKKQCDTAPCIVDQVAKGSHEVKVIAQGYDAVPDRAVTVEARKDSALDFTLNVASRGTGIKVAGSQPGVKLYVDGKEIGPLPQELHDLSPGPHAVRLAGTERYAPIEKSITLGANEIQDLGDQTLKVVKGKATITVGTPGAKVSIVSGSDRREFPQLPIAVDLETSKPWALEASKPGFIDYHQAVSFDDGVAEKTFNITLDPRGSGAAVAQWTPPANPGPAAPRAAARAAAPAAPAKDTDTSSDDSSSDSSGGGGASAAPAGAAFLNINSMPASSVILDGKPIGNTPKVKVQVTAGSHTVQFVNADQGLKKQITVNVGAGETKPAIARLRD